MNWTKTILQSLLLLFFCNNSFAQQSDNSNPNTVIASVLVDSTVVPIVETTTIATDTVAPTPLVNTTPQQQNTTAVYPPPFKDYRKLGYNSLLYVGAAVVVFGVLWVSPESFSNWNKEEIKQKGIGYKWKENVKAGPVWDHDTWVINYVTHPYSGAIYFMTARSSGFNFVESFAYSAIMSTFFWEYGIEAFAEIPSTQDLVVTPIIGSAMGEGFFYAKKSIIRHDKRVLKSRFLGGLTLFLIDPFNTILDGLGYKEKVKTQVTLAPIRIDPNSQATVWGVNFSAQF
jgi:hypothetical protein